MITKGGHGSGIRGHRTAKDSIAELDPKAKQDALAKLKAEQAKRAGETIQKPTAEKPVETVKPTRPARGHVKGGKSEKKRIAALMSDLSIGEEDAKKYLSSFKEYSDERYSEIRKGEGKYAEDQKRIEDYIEKAPTWDSKGTLYRGMTIPFEDAVKLKKGKLFDMQGLSSWSSDKETADEFAEGSWKSGSTAITFVVKKINKGTSIVHLSRQDENEVLVSKKSKFKIQKIEDGPPGISRLFVYVDEVE